MMDSFDKHMEAMQSSIGGVVDVMKEGNLVIRESNIIAEKGIDAIERGRPKVYSEEEVYAELLKIDVPDHIQLDAFLFLIKDSSKVRAFFAVPSERRLELLQKMMPSNNKE